MPVQPTYPGVYIEEIPSGVRTITGVATSIAVFIGRTTRGPIGKPIRCLSYTDFLRTFSTDTSFSDLPCNVKLFFDNGGSQCYVMRIANNATAASVTLEAPNEHTEVLILRGKDAGVIGKKIRAAITYNGAQPESTFNIELFRWETNNAGQLVQQNQELWRNLSMDPRSPRYAPTFLTQNSQLVDAIPPDPLPPPAGPGYSQSGRPVTYQNADEFRTAWNHIITPTANRFQISVAGDPYVEVNLGTIDLNGDNDLNVLQGNLKSTLERKIKAAFPMERSVEVSLIQVPSIAENQSTQLLRIASDDGDVIILPATTNDLAVPLMLGTDQGGLEVGRYASLRPAPTGITFSNLTHYIDFAGVRQNAFNTIIIDGTRIDLQNRLQTARDPNNEQMFNDDQPPARSRNGGNDGVRQKWGFIQQAINDYANGHPDFHWRAELWGSRLALIPTSGEDRTIGTIGTEANDISPDFTNNVRYYSFGDEVVGYQGPGRTPASDGVVPRLSDYRDAFEVIRKEVDLFNLLVLPADVEYSTQMKTYLYAQASIFCQERRAFLLMDAPAEWQDVQTATNGISSLRIGLVKDHSAIFYPRVFVNKDGLKVPVGASGAIAGLMGRIDSSRGVWKAPAGIEADLRGIIGLEKKVSDQENGVLNQRAINTLRVFPSGIVNWGARTMDGDDDLGSEWKYIPVRRLALYIEESLYRSTQWVVFEPNDELLWAQIRLNVGSFMQNLFRQGAFQGKTPREAYLVKCDKETTTQNDIDLGIVNILVGFAPLKPAEFVFIQIQQLAAQTAV